MAKSSITPSGRAGFRREVISPNDTLEEINDKIEDYLRYGVRLFVFVNMKRRTMHVYAGDKITILSETDIFDGGDVLPGFTLMVGDIFPKEEE